MCLVLADFGITEDLVMIGKIERGLFTWFHQKGRHRWCNSSKRSLIRLFLSFIVLGLGIYKIFETAWQTGFGEIYIIIVVEP